MKKCHKLRQKKGSQRVKSVKKFIGHLSSRCRRGVLFFVRSLEILETRTGVVIFKGKGMMEEMIVKVIIWELI